MNKTFTSDYVCYDCGNKYGKPRGGTTTIHMGICGVCGEEKGLCHQRNYGYFLNKDNWIYNKEE